jgi:hypothetical protein
MLLSLINLGAVSWILYIGAFIAVAVVVLYLISRNAFIAADISYNKKREETIILARENGMLLYKRALYNHFIENETCSPSDLEALDKEYNNLLKRQEQSRKTTYHSPKLEFI